VSDVVKGGRLERFGNLERTDAGDWMSACRHMVVVGNKGRGLGKPRKGWMVPKPSQVSSEFMLSAQPQQRLELSLNAPTPWMKPTEQDPSASNSTVDTIKPSD
jgi:hypothetical protein